VTRARSAVLGALEGSAEPLSAAGVIGLLGGACDQATVYRALDFLEREGLAESFIIHCESRGTERFYSPKRAAHSHWFHCVSCHRFIDVGACGLGPALERIGAGKGVEVRSHTLYFTGLCGPCGKKGGAKHADAHSRRER